MACRGSVLVLMWVLSFVGIARADGPGDNVPSKVRPIPPKGVDVPESDRLLLKAGVDELGKQIEELRTELKGRAALLELLPDIQIYEKAVRYALTYNEIFNLREVAAAKKQLEQGMERARQLRAATRHGIRRPAWWYAAMSRRSTARCSRTVWSCRRPTRPNSTAKSRLDVWCHGRGENLSELNFIAGPQSSPREFVPQHAFVLYPYGRYCNANKFAGEIDLFEALDHIKKHYPIDDDRLVMRGFSMGGAACWQFAVHYPSTWVAAAPGAGFSETPDFLKVFQNERVEPTEYEKKLWHLYDCTDYALNLFHCPTVAYSGENDRQKQAADMMAKALAAEGIELVHIKGAKAGHQYTPEAKAEINRRIDSIAALGREPMTAEIHFTTWTLRYNQCYWLQVDGLEQHWERARVDVDLIGNEEGGPLIETANVSAFTISIPPGLSVVVPFSVAKGRRIMIDEQVVEAPGPLSDRSWVAHFRKNDGHWVMAASVDTGVLRKRHGLQGPIDDAFMDSFMMVRPTGTPLNEKAGKWAAAEMQHAVEHWRNQFRGDARMKDDKDVTEADISAHNLVLWGDPHSNAVLAKIAGKLPIAWDEKDIQLAHKTFDSGHHVLVAVYPNPLNPNRYVVVNSGFTFREYDYLNNARQVPKLPDYAIVDIDVPVSARAPGGIAAAGFFDERWTLHGDK